MKKQNIKEVFYFPRNNKEDQFVYPPSIYQSIEKNKTIFPKKSINQPGVSLIPFENFYFFSPSFSGGLLSVKYYIEIKLKFETIFTSDEHIYLPIDFCSRPDEMEIDQLKSGNNMHPIDFNNPLISNNITNSYKIIMKEDGLIYFI